MRLIIIPKNFNEVLFVALQQTVLSSIGKCQEHSENINMNVVPALKWFHNWVGFVISISMLIVLVTGVYLGGMDMLKRMDDKGQQYVPLTIEQKAKATEFIFENYPKMASVRFPTEHTPYLEAATRGESIAFDSDFNEIHHHKVSEIPLWTTMFWLHRNFLLGDFGKYLNAWASLIGGLVTLVGIYLWWRIRKGFRLKQSIPTDTRSSSLVKSHIQLGLFISVPLFLLCITGFLITYKGLWMDALKHTPVAEVQYPISQKSDWQSQLQTAQDMWPESLLVSVSKPRQKKTEPGAEKPKGPQELNYSIGFDTHSDVWLRQADSITMNYEQGKIQSALLHSDRSFAGKVATFVRPLHDALNMPFKYVAFITVIAFIGTAILLFSAVTFYRRIFKKKRK
ncbi:PepSY domain-containing protein [Shewanella olleyana]|uniref:PepSY-associated TM helix domain-containing protein n=1 Tax=Shewanella olleyana TaxID=135626 RepID=UPI00200F5EF0|nr:PepSY-associated TM helix domain-containing protein [Shewanella olleyana]MCL1066142.1 PepSY domain-containing protein [Shewanella olleyana]